MATASQKPVSEFLRNWRNGDPEPFKEAVPILYKELRRLAKRYLRKERIDHTLQTTGLVHEAYLRLRSVEGKGMPWRSRGHFYATAAQMMRRILVDYAKHRGRTKRGGLLRKVPLNQATDVLAPADLDLVALDAALDELAALDPQQGRIVELRYFGGLTIEETADALSLSPATVKREWAFARTWLYRRLR